jgi:hypothetical protein
LTAPAQVPSMGRAGPHSPELTGPTAQQWPLQLPHQAQVLHHCLLVAAFGIAGAWVLIFQEGTQWGDVDRP